MAPEHPSRAGVVSQQLPRELVAELLGLARAHGADFAEVYGEQYDAHHLRVRGEPPQELRAALSSRAWACALIRGSETGYAYADGFDPDDLREAARVARRASRATAPPGVARSRSAPVDAAPPFTLREPAASALDEPAKIALLRRANDAARAHDRAHPRGLDRARRRHQVGSWSPTATACGPRTAQYLSRLTVSALGARRRPAPAGLRDRGRHASTRDYFERERTPEDRSPARRRAPRSRCCRAREPQAGSYPVVVAPGWGGVMVHECFGHSMEGDAIRKQTSIRATQRGQLVAAKGRDDRRQRHRPVQPRLVSRRRRGHAGHSAPCWSRTAVLVGFMWDLLNARLTGESADRERAARVVPRRSAVPHDEHLHRGRPARRRRTSIADVQRGLYCKALGGGSVNPADGNFSFQVTEAYQIENGKLTHPVRNATLTGNGNDAMLKIDARRERPRDRRQAPARAARTDSGRRSASGSRPCASPRSRWAERAT